MKVSFKPLSLALAVSAAAAGYAGTINAQTLGGNTSIGDLAIVPYYTVRDNWTTGVSIVNTSASTQVVKVRLRRATDSMDALDFNVVMSPFDVFNGWLDNDGDNVRFYTNDNTCTVPQAGYETLGESGAPYFQVPAIFADFAEEGYIEVIGMGRTINETQPIAVAAEHNTTGADIGFPADCDGLQNNFLRYAAVNEYNTSLPSPGAANPAQNGVVNSEQTVLNGLTSNFDTADNFMKVAWVIKDTTAGIEMGDTAVMIRNFLDGPSITNQVAAAPLDIEDLQGYDYPDLNGGAPLSASLVGADIGEYAAVRGLLGGRVAINEWSKNVQADVTVNTDWVITVPGQYTMLDLPMYLGSITGAGAFDPTSKELNPGCPRGPLVAVPAVPPALGVLRGCDFRDLPLTVTPIVYDREELEEEVPNDQIVISPTPPGTVQTNELYYEVNVIQWGDTPVLEAAASTTITVDLDGAVFGWAQLDMASTQLGIQAICTYDVLPVPATVTNGEVLCAETQTAAPIVGFAAWERNFTRNPDANYGRAIGHAYGD